MKALDKAISVFGLSFRLQLIFGCLIGTACFVSISQGQEAEDAMIGLSPSEDLQDFVLDEWSAEQGLPTDLINDVYASRYGYLYMATFSGLVRFDGADFEVMDSQDWEGLAGGATSIATGRSSGIWVGANGGGLNYYENGIWSKWGVEDGLMSSHVDALLLDSRDTLWIGTKHGLCKMRVGSDTIESVVILDREDTVHEMIEDSEGFIWLGVRSQGLFKLDADGNVVSHFPQIVGIDDLHVLSLTEASPGDLWIGTTEGLARLSGGRWEVFSMEDGLPGNTVSSVLYDPPSGLWILTEGGLARYRDGEFSVLSSLKDRAVLNGDLSMDREDSLWVGTWNGLFRVNSSRFHVIDKDDGLSGEAVSFVHEGPDGEIYFGGTGFLYVRDQEGGLRAIHPGLLDSVVVKDCLVDSDGRLWVMAHGGVFLIDGEEVRHFTTDDGLSSNLARAGWIDQAGKLWVATLGGINTYEGGQWTALERQTYGFSSDAFISINPDSEGRLWLTTDSGGVNIWDDGEVTVLAKEDGLPSDLAFRLSQDLEGKMWVATNHGLACISPAGEIMTLAKSDGLPDSVILQTLIDPSDQIWLLTNYGIYTTARKDVLSKMRGEGNDLRFRHLTIYDGLPDLGVAPGASKSIVGSDGVLWISTWRGLAYLDTGAIATNPHPPLVHVNKLQVDGAVWSGSSLNGNNFVLNPNPRKVALSFSAMGLRSQKKTYVEAYLEGFDDDWIPIGDQRTVSFTNLDPGVYTFKLRAQNEDLVRSVGEVTVTFEIEPALNERLGFWVVFVLALLLVVGMLIALRIRQIRSRSLQLEKLVNERTAELERRALELKSSHAQLGRSFEALKEVSNEKSEILGIAAHDMKNPVAGVIGLSDLVLDSLSQSDISPASIRDVREMVETLQLSAGHLEEIIDDLLTHAMVDEGKVPLRFGIHDLYVLAQEVIQLNVAQAERKSIRVDLRGTHDSCARVDPQRFREVLDNLISNAVKYSKPSTHVTVHLERMETTIRFQVEDQGPGLSPDDMKKLFRKFQKLTAVPTAGEHSTGLGLSIAKKLTEGMNGRIWAENNDGPGASFFLEFPVGDS